VYLDRRIQTSYVTVEPKRKRQVPSPQHGQSSQSAVASVVEEAIESLPSQLESAHIDDVSQITGRPRPVAGREQRRARIIITVKRTESYRQWLEDNPMQAISAIEEDDDDEEAHSIQVGITSQST
jgi:hypothetical protein